VLCFQNHVVIPSRYTLNHADTSRTEALRAWRLDGSMDGKKWIPIDEKSRDTQLNAKGSNFTHEIKHCEDAYCYFRLNMIGPNSGNMYNLALGGIELYGTLRKKVTQAHLLSPHCFTSHTHTHRALFRHLRCSTGMCA
jgi:hypothetical protein